MISILLTPLSQGIKGLSKVMKSARFCASEEVFFHTTSEEIHHWATYSKKWKPNTHSEVSIAWACTWQPNFASH